MIDAQEKNICDKYICKGNDVGRCKLFDNNCPDRISHLDILKKFAKLFEMEHQIIKAKGATTIEEYDTIWHMYKDEVRPIIAGEL